MHVPQLLKRRPGLRAGVGLTSLWAGASHATATLPQGFMHHLGGVWQDHPDKIVGASLMAVFSVMGVSALLWRSNRRLRKLTQIHQEAQAGLTVMAAAFDSQIGLMVVDEHCRIQRANAALLELFGYAADAVEGMSTRMLRSPSLAKGSVRQMWATLQTHGRWQGELPFRHHNGHDVPCMVTITPLRKDGARVTGYVAAFTDLSDQKDADRNIRQLAYFDPLTQLPNRRMFMETLQSSMNTALHDGTLAGIMFIDLDHFKNLNDTHGHIVGDQLLRHIAQRLEMIIGPNDLAARLGGDEFVVLLPALDTSESIALDQAMAVAQDIHAALLEPYELGSPSDMGNQALTFRYTCSGSIGVALFGMLSEPLTEVLKRADVAMYQAKHAGRNLVRAYEPAAQKALHERMALSNDLNLALRDHQLHLVYQLQVDMHDQPIGAECLMRWSHPTQGQVSPGQFIPLAEESGAIIAMGDWVMLCACETLARWAHLPAMQHLTLSINVSPRQFSEADFVQRVQRMLARTGAQPNLLRLELTESIVMQDAEEIIERMRQLCAMGLSFSIDDFGTGYSSLSYIQRLPLAELKIDKAFVHDVTTSERSAAIVKAIIALGASMQLIIVSEGVETEAQKQQLLAFGCRHLQGYLICHPVERGELERLVCSYGARVQDLTLL